MKKNHAPRSGSFPCAMTKCIGTRASNGLKSGRFIIASWRQGIQCECFPLSNWTELDIWRYIHREQIEIVPLYFAKPRPVVWRNGAMLMVDDDRFPLDKGESPELRMVRFRTLGCYPLTAAVDSKAETLDAVLEEMASTRLSERHGRLIDHDQAGAMEQKKRNGYF